jgi:signal transduction histidine kinase
VIVLQARGARHSLTDDPDDARHAVDAIERTASQALSEMRRLLAILRADDAATLAPQPSLEHLEALAVEVRGAGLPVEVQVEGEPRGLSPGVDASAYRIVQEALTNALKHAGRARAVVTIRYGPDALDLEVADDGKGATNGDGGHGLIGMRERAAVFGGTIEAGPQQGGGYVVRARLPL